MEEYVENASSCEPCAQGGTGQAKVSVRDLDLWYGDHQALRHISLDVPARTAMALIGPSGCGKSTLLRTMNRMCDLVADVRHEGEVCLDGESVFPMDANALRSRVGMVFQHPNPFPMSIRDNVCYGPRRRGGLTCAQADDLTVSSLGRAGLLDEVKDDLDRDARDLSGGQQQRLCIARAIAMGPEVLLMDEPTSALDPISTELVEQLMRDLARDHTVVVVTHNMQQATRVADRTAFFLLGELVEEGATPELFARPKDKRTEDYLTGRFG
jgi:phosphate transport system ATP-binding protein